jgi:FAD/FMN-containing dehydrogenase
MADDFRPAPIGDVLRQIVGAHGVFEDEAVRALMSEDIWARGGLAACVVAPGSTEELAAVVAAITRAGRAVLPRGGGMSYTGGYVQPAAGGVVIDLRRMDRVLEINPGDMYVRVEAGCTWAALHEALSAHGLRTPFWGPLSGVSSTVGGGASQNNTFFGATRYGTTADSILSLAVVLADGTIVRTGTAGSDAGKPFFRHYGPDLTGLFLCDTGALGVKAEVTLRLIPRPTHEDWASFSFDAPSTCAAAMSAMARADLAAELFGFDPNLARVRMKRASLLADAQSLAKVVTAQGSLIKGLQEGAKIALAGRGFLDGADYSIHAVVEGRSAGEVGANMAALKKIAAAHGAREVENTIPKVIRAQPFTPLNNVLGPDGSRWAPVHGIVAHSDAAACWAGIDQLFAEREAAFAEHGIVAGYLVAAVATNGFVIEPVFYWPEARFALHEATIEPAFLKKLPALPENPAATQIVAETRGAIAALFARYGAAHFQIGRTYPFAQTRTPAVRTLIEDLKRLLDPQGLVNPGVLGLP